jgi:hypothetical protein
MPSRTGRKLVALQEKDVAPTETGEMVGNAAADHTATNNDHAGLLR